MTRACRAAGAREPDNLLILGLGNVICGDDGLGVAAAERLRRDFRLPDGVEIMDGGTLGLSLLAHVTGARDLILLDAVAADAVPGTLVRLEGGDVGPAVRDRLSVHQIGVADLLDAMRLLDQVPRRLVLLGLVPETLELAVERSPAVAAKIDDLVAAAAAEARALGHPLRRRAADATLLAGDEPHAHRAHRAHRALGL